MTALRNYDVCMALRRFDELHVHGPDRREVLFDDGFHRAIALGNISSQPAYESNVVRRIDEDLDIHLLQQTRVGEDQDTLDDHDGFWLDDARFFQTRMCLEVVE